jgi:hypothetical protein
LTKKIPHVEPGRAETSSEIQSKFVWERFATAIKIDRIPLFDVSRLGVISFIDQTGRSAASCWAET